MIIVAGGDSHVWGSELADSPHGGPNAYSRQTFTSLLAKDNNYQYLCAAYPGYSNSGIARTIINTCETTDGNKFVLVCWSFVNRYEFRFTYDTMPATSPWMNIHTGNTDFRNDVANRDQLSKFVTAYSKHVGMGEYNEIYVTLKEILFLQQYLKQKNIPYLFTTVDNRYYQHENYNRNKDLTLDALYNNIDWNNWYFFPPGTAVNETVAPRGFYQWAVENRYSIGPQGHPLEQAHHDATELIKEKFDELVIENLQ